MAVKNGRAKVTQIGPVSNAAEGIIGDLAPYTATVRIKGTCDLLFHRWNCEAVEEKANAAKGSKAKKTDNIESYVSRDADGIICLPGEYLRSSIVGAARFKQDPRSSRKSAMDLYKAAIIPLTALAPVLVAGSPAKNWEYEHRAPVSVMRARVTRTRPAFKVGWEAEVELLVNLPHYVSPQVLCEVIGEAGRLIGVGDFRPTYGRFQVVKFQTDRERGR